MTEKPTVTMEVMIATKDDIIRLETSVKELTTAVKDVILLGERQTVQGKRIGDLETENGVLRNTIEKLEKKVDGIMNKVIGGWAVIVTLGALIEVVIRK